MSSGSRSQWIRTLAEQAEARRAEMQAEARSRIEQLAEARKQARKQAQDEQDIGR